MMLMLLYVQAFRTNKNKSKTKKYLYNSTLTKQFLGGKLAAVRMPEETYMSLLMQHIFLTWYAPVMLPMLRRAIDVEARVILVHNAPSTILATF